MKAPQSIRKRIQLEAQEYVLLNDILCKINNTDIKNQFESNLLIVIPEKYQPMVFHQYHNNILASHQGTWKTYITMKKNFYFPGMLNKLKQYITTLVKEHNINETKMFQCMQEYQKHITQ